MGRRLRSGRYQRYHRYHRFHGFPRCRSLVAAITGCHNLAALPHPPEEELDGVARAGERIGDLAGGERLVGFAEDAQDLLPLVAAADLLGGAEESPGGAGGFPAEGQLALLEVTSEDAKGSVGG